VLRAEVRVAADLRQEVISMSSDMAKMKAEIDDMRVKLTSAVDEMWPAMSASSNIDTNSQSVPVLSTVKSFAKHAQSLQSYPGTVNR